MSKKESFVRKLKASYVAMFDMFKYSEFESAGAGSASFRVPPSFAKMIRLAEYDYDNHVFWLSDAKTPVAMYEIKGFATEGTTPEMMKEFHQRIFEILSLFPQYSTKEGPWTVQMYAKDESDLSQVYEDVVDSVPANLKETKLSKVYLNILKEHFDYISQPSGIFTDINGAAFKGKTRKVRLVFYRRSSKNAEQALKEINKLRRILEIKLKVLSPLGMKSKKINEKDYFKWMFTKFHISVPGYADTKEYLDAFPFMPKGNRPYGYDIIERALAFPIESNNDEGWWKIGDTYHKYVAALSLTRPAEIGATSAERTIADVQQAWLDGLPLGSEFHMTFNSVARHEQEGKMDGKAKRAERSLSTDAQKTMQEVAHFKNEFVNKNFIYPTQVGCFVSATSLDELEEKHSKVTSAIQTLYYEFMPEVFDNDRLDKFIRFLPGNYDPIWDNQYCTAKLTSVKDLARLAPIGYGRASGSETPLFINYNRNGEVVFANPYTDKVNNRHKVLMGSTGAGKSVNVAEQIVALMAMSRPYMVIVDAGKSFEFVIDFLKEMNVSTKKIEIKMTDGLPDISLNPFLETASFIKQIKSLAQISEDIKKSIDELLQASLDHAESKYEDAISSKELTAEEQVELLEKAAEDGVDILSEENDIAGESEEEVIQRDYIAEFLSAALIIATGGRDLKDLGFTDHHKRDLIEVIQELAYEIDKSGLNRQILASDIANRLKEISEEDINSDNILTRNKAMRCDDLYAGFAAFLNSSLNRKYFDVPAKPMEALECTYFELGLWKDDNESNKAPRALAMATLISQQMTLCESRQNLGRNTVLFIDECHILLSGELTSASLVQCGKMSRKIGLDLMLATQDPEDFSGSAAKLLANFENFQLLDFNADTTRLTIAKMLGLTDMSLGLARSIRNQGGKYTESLLVNKKYNLLTRCIPPKPILNLALNNPEEKAARSKLSIEYKCTEVETAFLQAQKAHGLEMNLLKVREILEVNG